MNKESIRKLVWETVASLSHSQGFYSRLRMQIGEGGVNLTDEQLELFKDCHSNVDVVLALES